jgi:hypothetical protein
LAQKSVQPLSSSGVKINQHVLAKEVPDKKHISALKNNYLTSSVTDTKVNYEMRSAKKFPDQSQVSLFVELDPT